MRRARASIAARRMPGKPSRLFTERPSAAKAAPAASASSGRISGSGFVSARMPWPRRTWLAGGSARRGPSSRRRRRRCAHELGLARDGRRRRAARSRASAVGRGIEAQHRAVASRPGACARWPCPRRRGRSRRPAAPPAAARRAASRSRSAASTATAVPCWSSCSTGISSASTRRRSTSKQTGDSMSSSWIAPKPRRDAQHGLDDRVGVARIEHDRPGGDADELVQEGGLALHHRQRRDRARRCRARARACRS